MKTPNYFLLFLSLSLIVITACNQGKKPDATKPESKSGILTLVSGKLQNADDKQIILSWGNNSDTLFADAENNFSKTIFMNQSDYLVFRNSGKNVRLFLTPGDSLQLTFDAQDVYKSLNFEGNGSVTNDYLKQKYTLLMQHAFSGSQRFELPVKEFRYLSDSLYVVEKIFLEDYAANHPTLPEAFIEKEQAALLYDWATQLMEYPRMNQVNATINPDRYFKFLERVSVNEPQYLSLYEYRQFLNAYIAWYTQQQMDEHPGKELETQEVSLLRMQQVNRRITNPKVKDYLLASMLKEQIRYFGYKNTETLFQVFALNCTDDSLKNTLMEPYQQYMNLKASPDAPEFEMIAVDGNTVSLANFKGSYVYIDVWATWCLPCKKESPYFDQLKEKYNHKNIRFIGVSVDEKKADWQEYLKVRPSGYEQFWIPDVKPFLDAYLIKTIPHFLIIDPDGRLINPNAFRPSEPDVNWFEQLPDKPGV